MLGWRAGRYVSYNKWKQKRKKREVKEYKRKENFFI